MLIKDDSYNTTEDDNQNKGGRKMKELVDFQTELRAIQVCGGRKIPDRKAVVRQDTNEVLGIVGNNYRIVPHQDVIGIFEKVPDLTLKRVDSCQRGAIMFAHFDIRDGDTPLRADVAVGDTVNFGLRVFNSFNSIFGVG